MQRVRRLSPAAAQSVEMVGMTYGKFWKLFQKETRDGRDWKFEGNVTTFDFCSANMSFRVHDSFCNFESEEISLSDFEAQTRELLRGAP